MWKALADQTSAEALEIKPDLEETNFARGWAHQLNGRIDAAIASYEHVVELDGDTPAERQMKSFAQTNHAYVSMTELGDLTGAEGLLHDALDWYPNKMAHAYLGELHARQHRCEEALDDYRAALRLDDQFADAMNDMALVYLEKARSVSDETVPGLIQQADECHARALALVPRRATNQVATLEAKYKKRRGEVTVEPA
jgi:tetratricopeptide (TPR) repeat protein